MYNPIATYRFQFHKNFAFNQLETIIPYLEKLGVSTVYASPVFESTPGSTHGYDGTDPHTINPEIGTLDQFYAIDKKLKHLDIGWLQDIVPNHMAFNTGNRWLMDVLEKGEKSVYAAFFDLSWTGQIFKGRIMVPFLGSTLQEVIDNKELKIDYQDQRLVFNYFDNYYPLSRKSYTTILKTCGDRLQDATTQLITQAENLKQVEDPKTYALEWNEFMVQFNSLMKNEKFAGIILNEIGNINEDAEKIKTISDEQVYQLSYWQRTDSKINFRRFFTVNGLIALNIHDREVFDYHHKMIKQLVDEGVIQGVRIDHIDGLYDPTEYLHNLRALCGNEAYIVVEKILEPGEPLLKEWPIQGNSGYDFLAMVNNLFTEKSSEERFTDFYQKLVEDDTPVHQQILNKKAYILSEHMGGELDNLTRLFKELNLADPLELDQLPADELSLAIGEMLIQCPVYRFYGNRLPLDKSEATAVKKIIEHIKKDKNQLTPALNIIENALLVKPLENDATYNTNALRFYQRYMQFTGPLMAKGVEDTLMYTYNRFIAHNEVGDSPEAFGFSVEEFHDLMLDRQRYWPLALNATSTHDTKRGEDVRARLNVLTNLPDEWFDAVEAWMQMNADLKVNGAPSVNDEYFIYQTLAGVFAMPGQDEDNISERLQEYLQKALREAKDNSNWTTPDETYEQAAKDFALQLLDKSRPFWKSFSSFHHKISKYGVVNSLAQVLLRFTCPGVPDTYQGTEFWDLGLVDPDNRRPVNYELLQQWMDEVDEQYRKAPEHLLTGLWSNPFEPKIKLWLIHALFNLRKQHPDLFEHGEYIPLKVEGDYSKHIIAFARKHGDDSVVVIAPLHMAELCEAQQKELADVEWGDTRVVLPFNTSGEVENVLIKDRMGNFKEIEIQHVFNDIPLAVLKITPANGFERSAGLLMHITSLPSPFGIGDMGPQATKFADFLNRTGQKYWQILPLNPTENGQGHSPYSAISSRAGNTLLISPELLVADGLLDDADLQGYNVNNTDKVDFAEAEKLKTILFNKAWLAYNNDKAPHLEGPFAAFCKQEKEWLDDFALYLVLKQKNNGSAWFQWPEEFKLRSREVLDEVADINREAVDKIKWLQFIFLKQWKELRAYCNQINIKLFGDLPFYASYDSVDVWAHPELFALNDKGELLGVAGVPPDGFSDDGQLWGMPVFNWDVLKNNHYSWWIERLRKNAQLFDLLRLDHFRAFADFWEVPAGETTAKNGVWQRGPRSDFFRVIKKNLGNFPMVAEDLGEINDPVYELRDEFKMPGMKVLQFAFGDDLPQSNYIPHNYTENYIVYTGTHDNNTTKGWYRTDTNEWLRERLNQYTGQQVTEENINDVFMRMALGSVAKIAIIPIQDLLDLDETARMNRPATVVNNWSWRLLEGQLDDAAEQKLANLTRLFNR